MAKRNGERKNRVSCLRLLFPASWPLSPDLALKLIDQLGEGFGRHNAALLMDWRLFSFEKQDSRDSHHVVFHGYVRVLIDIEFSHFDFSSKLVGHLIDDG